MVAKNENKKNPALFSPTVGTGTVIDPSVLFEGKVQIGNNCFIGANVIIGHPSFYDLPEDFQNNQLTSIGDNVIIHPNVIISRSVTIGKNVRIGPFVTIWKNTMIDENTQLMYNAQVHENVSIGKNCKIGGFLCDYSKVADSVIIMGSLVHSLRGWNDEDDLENESPVIEDNVIVGCGSVIIGHVTLKKKTYVAAGAIVTKSTVGNCRVTLCNHVDPIGSEYKGKLKDSEFFRG
jgi:UDP-3-O-[3-hydroxymyristoyl] glucosamine N-acyltransferase